MHFEIKTEVKTLLKQNKKADQGKKINQEEEKRRRKEEEERERERERAEEERRERKKEEKRLKAELRKKRLSEPGEVNGYLRVVPVVLVAIAIFTALCFITGETGAFGAFISKFLKGLFSYMAYSIPFFICLHAIFFYKDIREHKVLTRAIASTIAVITLSEAAYIISPISNDLVFDIADFYNFGTLGQGGGFIGSVIGFALAKTFGKIGLIIIIVVSVILITFYFAQGFGLISRFFLEKAGKVANYGARVERRAQEKKLAKKEAQWKKHIETDDKKHAEIYNDDYFHADNGLSHLEIPELGIKETKNGLGDTNILRETVLRNEPQSDKNNAYSANYEEKSEQKKHGRKRVHQDPSFIRVDNPASEKNFRKDDIIYEEARDIQSDIDGNANGAFPDESADEFFKQASSTARSKETIADYGIDDSASAVFTADFDPYDIAINERRASKQSSRAAEIKKEPAEYSELITELTPEQYEQSKRLEEFERKRQEALRRRSEATAKNDAAAASFEHTITEENSYDKPSCENHTADEIDEIKEENQNSRNESDLKSERPSSYQNIRTVADFNSNYEMQYGHAAEDSSSEGARYRFVKEVAEEPRIAYSNEVAADSKDLSESPKMNSSNERKSFSPPKTTFEFIIDDDDEENAADSEAEEFITITPAKEREEPATLEVSRSIIEPNIEIPEKHGLDFTFDEDEIDEESYVSEEPEEFVEKTEIPPEDQNPKINEYRNMFTVLDNSNDTFAEKTASNDDVYSADEIAYEDFSNDAAEELSDGDASDEDTSYDEPPFDMPTYANSSDKPKKEIPKQEEKPKPALPDYSNYRFPPIDLLKKAVTEDLESVKGEMQTASEQLINTLESFNIRATLRGMERGPRITRYSIVPAKGIRVNQIEKLSDDIALAMAAESIRIEAPIPGKSAVGIEVPNKIPTIVSLRELLESDEFMSNKSKTAVCLGKSVEGTSVFGDIGKMPHVLVAGATGMGKSVCMNSLITSILYKARPDEVKFIMIDPKKVEFALYKGIPHLLVPVVTDPKQAAGSLLWAVDEMNRRYEVIEKLSIRNIDTYNEMVASNPELGAPLPKIVIFIDELNDLMMQARDPVENLIMLIAQKARAAGIHLVIGTQRPSVNVITGVIKANIPTRIACKVTSGIDSRTILEQTGAEKLIGKGDMLFATTDKPNPIRVQGAYVSEAETNAIVDFVKAQVKGEIYDEQAMEDMKRAAQKCDKKNSDEEFDDDDDDGGIGYLHDRKFLNAVELAIRNGSVATSFLQRKLHIGYGKAAQYIDIMEDLGIVGEKNGSKARDILISMSEWNEKLSRLTCD